MHFLTVIRNSHFPLFVGSRYLFMQEALRDLLNVYLCQSSFIILCYKLYFNRIAFAVAKKLEKKFVDLL